MKIIDKSLFTSLKTNASNAVRKRSNVNFHDSFDAKVQRLFIYMEHNSYVRPHFHPEDNKWEFFLVLQGALDFLLFDSKGMLTQRLTLDEAGDIKGVEIPPNHWHCTLAHEDGALFLEVKEGPYVVSGDKHFAPWSPPEGDASVSEFMHRLRTLKTGEKATI